MAILCALIHFSFLHTYIQDFRASTIEPLFEFLPGAIKDLNPRMDLVLTWQNVPLSYSYWYDR